MGGSNVIIHCDGACFPNPGKGSWGAVITHLDGAQQELMGASDEERTTNQRMEIFAAIKALESLKEPSTVQVFSDSQYLIKCATGRWKRKANLDLWGRLRKIINLHHVSWHWVKGHDGNKANERADELSTLASPVPAEDERGLTEQMAGTEGRESRRQERGRTFQRVDRGGRRGSEDGREEKARRSLLKYPAELRGLPNNRYGGHQSIRMRTYNAQLAWGSAGECHVYTEEEKRELEKRMRAEGRLDEPKRCRAGR